MTKTSSMLSTETRSHCCTAIAPEILVFRKNLFNCTSGIFQTKGHSASLCAATEVVGLEEAELIFCQH